jgi:hypothetical protein
MRDAGGYASDGGRGGALGFAFTFIMLFKSRRAAEANLADRLGQTSHALSDGLTEPDPVTLSESLEQLIYNINP